MRARAVVIGAGIVGSSIALELARTGFDVVVVDKAAGPGHGSTSASSAIVRFNYSTWAGVATSWEARYAWLSWREHLSADIDLPLAGFHRTGLAMLDAPQVPRSRYLGLFDRAHVPYEEWDAATLATRIPGIDVGRYGPPARLDDDRFWSAPHGELGAVYTPDAGFIDDPLLAAANLAAAAASHGAVFHFRRMVTAIAKGGDRVHGVQLEDGELIEADIVVNAAGPWSGPVNRLAEVEGDFTIGVRPLRQEVHQVPGPPGYQPEGSLGITVADLDLGTYLRPEPGGGLMIGGTEPECDPFEWLESADDADPYPTGAVFDAQVTRAARRFPELAIPGRPRGIAGVYDVTDDWAPIYDRTRLAGFYVAMGTSGNQFKNAPVIGRLMAGLIDEVESGTDHDATPVQFTGEHTGAVIDLGAFSRRRGFNPDSTGTVMG